MRGFSQAMYHQQAISRARKLRSEGTIAERVLWSKLRDKQLYGVKFRRQVPIGEYIVDFVCFERNLIIEIDGGQHNEEQPSEEDNIRTAWLESQGFHVLRFWNNEVLSNLEGVLTQIRVILNL